MPLWIRFLQLYTSLIKVEMIVALLWQTLKSKKDTYAFTLLSALVAESALCPAVFYLTSMIG